MTTHTATRAMTASNRLRSIAMPLAARLLHQTGLAVVVSALSAVALSASAQPAPPAGAYPAAPASGVAPMARPGGPMPHRMDGPMGARGEGMGQHMEGMGGMRGMRGMGPDMLSMHGSPERMARMIDRMLDGLNATDAQRAQVKQIAASAATDLKAQHEAGKAMHQRAMQLFTAPTIDNAAVEKMRQQTLAQHDQASKRMTQAMLDIGRVLTPEQRARIGERLRDRAARMQDRTERMRKMGAERPYPPR